MPNIIKSGQMEGDDHCQQYCFPDILSECSGESSVPADTGRSFRRIELGRNAGGIEVRSHVTSDGVRLDALSPAEAELEAIEKIKEAAYHKGYEEGACAGRIDLEPLLEGLKKSLCELEQTRAAVRWRAEQETVKLALAIARKVVTHEVSINPDVILKVAHQALKRASDCDQLTIRVNPADRPHFENNRHEWSEMLDDRAMIRLTSDDAISCGSCVIETNVGEIDGRIENQFQVLEEDLKQALQHHGGLS